MKLNFNERFHYVSPLAKWDHIKSSNVFCKSTFNNELSKFAPTYIGYQIKKQSIEKDLFELNEQLNYLKELELELDEQIKQIKPSNIKIPTLKTLPYSSLYKTALDYEFALEVAKYWQKNCTITISQDYWCIEGLKIIKTDLLAEQIEKTKQLYQSVLHYLVFVNEAVRQSIIHIKGMALDYEIDNIDEVLKGLDINNESNININK